MHVAAVVRENMLARLTTESPRSSSVEVEAPVGGIPHVSNSALCQSNYITREGMGFCVRPNQYALALESGEVLSADVFALHECDIPVCVKVNPSECLRQRVVAGTQHENMRRMARARRGGGRTPRFGG